METGISLFSLLIALASAIFSISTYKQSVILERKQSTLDAFNTLQEQVLDKLNQFSNTEIKDVSKQPRSKEYKELSVLMARIEHFSVGVNSDIYDLEIVKRLAGKYFCSIYHKLLPMIEEKRKINKTDKHYDEFELLADKLANCYKN